MSAMKRDFWIGMLVGAAAGFVAAILTAPEPGENVRQTIKTRGIELRDKAVAAGEEAQRMAEDLQRKASQTIEQEVQRVSQAIEQQGQQWQDDLGEQPAPPPEPEAPAAEAPATPD